LVGLFNTGTPGEAPGCGLAKPGEAPAGLAVVGICGVTVACGVALGELNRVGPCTVGGAMVGEFTVPLWLPFNRLTCAEAAGTTSMLSNRVNVISLVMAMSFYYGR